MMRFILIILGMSLAISCVAQESGDTSSCAADLNNLVVSNYKTRMNKKDISVELLQNHNGVYAVTLYNNKMPFDRNDLNKRIIDHATLDINENYVMNQKSQEDMNIDKNKIKSFADKCLRKKFNGSFITTNLPLRLDGDDGYAACSGQSYATNECGRRYVEYQRSDMPSYILDQADSSADVFLALPPFSNLTPFLVAHTQAEDVTSYYLYVFKGNKLIAKDTIGGTTDNSSLSFDINKEYLVTTYLRIGADITEKTKIKKVEHKRLLERSQIMTCPNSNPACK